MLTSFWIIHEIIVEYEATWILSISISSRYSVSLIVPEKSGNSAEIWLMKKAPLFLHLRQNNKAGKTEKLAMTTSRQHEVNKGKDEN